MKGIWAVVVAAGSGVRLGGETPKVLYPLAGRPLLAWTLAPFAASRRVEGICVVKAPAITEAVKSLLESTGKPWIAVDGGPDRGARPCLTAEDVEGLIDSLLERGTAVAGYPARDTLHRVDAAGAVLETPDRAQLWTVQTPQCFGRAALAEAYEHARAQGLSFTDDAAVYRWNGGKVWLTQTRPDNLKLTTKEDLPLLEAILCKRGGRGMRIGTGYDVHRLVPGRRLVIGGVEIPHERGLEGHSDADVLAQRPKLMPYRAAMIEGLAGAMGLSPGCVSVKATTTEGLGFEGRQEGISAQATALLLQAGV